MKKMKTKADAKWLVDHARVDILCEHPFFASILMKHEIQITEGAQSKCPTACVDKKGTLWIDKDFVNRLSPAEVRFLLAHEVMHVVYAHLPRMLGRDPEVWNTACDAVINAMLKQERIGSFIDGGVDMPEALDKTADEVYEMLMSQKKKDQQKKSQSDSDEGGGGSNSSGNGDDGEGSGPQGIGQDLLEKETEGLSSANVAEAQNQGKVEIAQAAQACRIAGMLSGTLAKRIQKLLETKTPWHQILEQYMCGHAEMHHSWSRPNKRYAGRFYLPRRERLPSMGEVVVQIDTSGSITDEMINGFMGEVSRIIELCRPSKVHLLYTTTDVEWERTFERDEELEWPVNAYCGGTDMREGVRWAEENAPDAELIITFTDGYTPYPNADDTEIPMIWVITPDGFEGDAPFGETIRV